MSLRRLVLALLSAALLAAGLPVVAPTSKAAESMAQTTIATSLRGRPIRSIHLGPADAPVRLVVLGQMHGDEPAGRRIVELLTRRSLPEGVQLWLVSTMNPDGAARHSRTNAEGVDLNRNFPSRWQRTKIRSLYFSGYWAASEPETKGMMRFLTSVRPTAVISFHQAYGMVDDSSAHSRAAARQLGRLLGMRVGEVPCRGTCRGTMTSWVEQTLEAVAVTVELRAKVTPAGARRAASSVLDLGAWFARGGRPLPVPQPTGTPQPSPTASPGVSPSGAPDAPASERPTPAPVPASPAATTEATAPASETS